METLTFRQPRVVALVLLVLIAGGLSALLSIGRQEDPTITNIYASVTTVFPGADPARVEALVTAKLEEKLREIPEVDTLESTSGTGISIITIELMETLEAERIEQVWSEARDAIADARRDFPDGVLEPEFSSDGGGAFAAIVSLAAVHDSVPMTIVARYADDLAQELQNVPGTKLVDIFGQPEEEVLVTVDPAGASALGLSADRIAAAIRAADAKVQAGRLRGGTSDILISVEGEITALDRLRRVIVRESEAGLVTRLSDIATVSRGARLPPAETALQDGRPAILVAARIQDDLQVDVWMSHVKAVLADYDAIVPDSVSLQLVFDQSGYTADRLREVGLNMALGVGLVVAVLFVTLGARSAAIVALILPVVSLATLATMNIIGLSIHQMSVTGLIVALGLLVDSAIVMTDDVGRRLRAGVERLTAVRLSVRRLFMPLLASTVTTALSFTPMILLPGPPGDFVGAIAVAVVTMLAWSFVLAVTITPAISGWILPDRSADTFIARGVRAGALGRMFRATVAWAVANPIRSIMLSLVLPVMGYAAAPTLTAQFFPGVERDQFYLEVELPPGTALEETRRTAGGIDRMLRAEDRIETVSWVMGRSAPAFYYNIVSDRDSAPGFAQALVTSASSEATRDLVPDLQRRLGDAFPQARVLVRALVQGPPVNAPVELRFIGADMAVLRELGDEAREIVAAQEMVTLVRTSIDGGAPKVSFDIDEGRARLLGLDLAGVARQLEAGLEGVTGGSLVEGTEQLPVRVRVGSGVRGDLTRIGDFPLLPPQTGGSADLAVVPLSTLADVRLEPSESVISRRNMERYNTIQAFLVPGVLPEEALQAVQAELDARNFTLPPGYRLEYGGDADARSSTLNNLLASLGLIVTLSIATIVLTFNSFRLSAIAFVVAGLSAGLSLLALAVFRYPLGIVAVIGVIGSIGVSINAAIIILTGLQQDAAASAGDRRAMTDVVVAQSRHIVSTTVTTLGGFLPLLLAGGGFWPPFAMSIAGGVLLSTVVSFYFTPPMFALVYARKRRAGRRQAPPADQPYLFPLAAE